MTKKKEDEGVRDFAVTLRHVEHGDFMVELAEKQQGLMLLLAEVAEQRGSATGELTMKLKYKMAKNGTVEITPDIGVKSPKAPRGLTIAWATPGGNLVAADPKQTTLNLRDVGGGAAPAREPAGVAAGQREA